MTRRRLAAIAVAVLGSTLALALVSSAVLVQLPSESRSSPQDVLLVSADGRRLTATVSGGTCGLDGQRRLSLTAVRDGDLLQVAVVSERAFMVRVGSPFASCPLMGTMTPVRLAMPESVLGMEVISAIDGRPVKVRVCEATQNC